jgi:SAM-dependent methyltransferase
MPSRCGPRKAARRTGFSSAVAAPAFSTIPSPTPHTDNDYSIRAYVEGGAGIIVFTTNLAPVLARRPRGAFLDIGCGYGYSVDFVRHMYGWDVLGVEPSQYGAAGAAALGFPHFRELLLDPAQIGGRKFNVIHSSEVLEHIPDPRAFLRLIRALLTDDGVFVMTTPSAAAVNDPALPWARKMAALSPGFHVFLMSARGLDDAMRDAGFHDRQVVDGGGSLIAKASPTKLTVTPVSDQRELYWSYLESGIARTGAGTSVRMGFFYRLFESLIGAGAYERALRVWNADGFTIPDKLPEIRHFGEFMDALPFCGANLAFARAVLALNYEQEPRQAADWFARSVEICAVKLRIAPRAAILETQTIWNAKFHQAIALVLANDRPAGQVIARAIVEAGAPGFTADPVAGRPPADIVARATELLA